MSRAEYVEDRRALLEFARKVAAASVGHSCSVLAGLQADARQAVAYVEDEGDEDEEDRT